MKNKSRDIISCLYTHLQALLTLCTRPVSHCNVINVNAPVCSAVQRLSLSLNLQTSGSMNKEQRHSFRRQVLRRGWGLEGASRSIKGESSSAVWSDVITCSSPIGTGLVFR